MNKTTSLLFLLKTCKISKLVGLILTNQQVQKPNILIGTFLPKLKKKKLKKRFLKKFIYKLQVKATRKLKTRKRVRAFFFINRFVIQFLEFFFKRHIMFNIKKGSSKLVLRQMSFRKFIRKYFRKTLKTSKQIIGVIYYSLLLKDSRMFTLFFRKILEKINIKLHKKLFLGLKKILKDLYRPIFSSLGVLGLFFSVRGKVGVSGNAKKRRHFFYFGRYSISSRTVKMDISFSPV